MLLAQQGKVGLFLPIQQKKLARIQKNFSAEKSR